MYRPHLCILYRVSILLYISYKCSLYKEHKCSLYIVHKCSLYNYTLYTNEVFTSNIVHQTVYLTAVVDVNVFG